MNKVFLIRNVAPDKYGGGEIYQLRVGKKLKKAGFEVFIVTASEKLLNTAKKEKINAIRASYIKRQNWSGWRNVLLPVYFWKQYKLRKWYRDLYRKYKPDVVNIQSRDEWIAATLAARKEKILIYWTDHADFRNWVLQNVNVPGKNLIGKLILKCAKYAKRIIMISDFERKFFEEVVGKTNNLTTIKNGVEDKYEKYKKVNPNEEEFCFVGRIVAEKGINELLEAFSIVKKEYPEIILKIYGDGTEVEKCKEIANNGVYFMGYSNNPLEAIAKSGIFVLPSYQEGLSMSLLDAAMMKKVIIASNVGGNPEIIQDGKTGFLVPIKNVEELVKTMKKVLEMKNKEEIAKNARIKYKKNFDFDRIFAEEMLPLYNCKKGE